MKYVSILFVTMLFNILTLLGQNYEPQGTTVKNKGCNIILIIQIALDNDSTGDIANIQSALNGCFFPECDIPCGNGKKGRCRIITNTLVVAWNNLSDADKPKFHHITMESGQGVSFVQGAGIPNNGKSTSGIWYRDEYSPKVYCHETMHLAGLPDHYRDCRGNKNGLYNNCKDNDTCTAAQIAAGICPPCKGYEDDLMGSDVTKPVDCDANIAEVIRIANGLKPMFYCPDSCCENRNSLIPKDDGVGYNTPKIPNEIFIGLSTIREDSKPKAFNTYGIAIDFNHYISQHTALTADLGINFGSSEGIDYIKKMVLVGATVVDVLDRQKREIGLDIDFHVLGGISSITSKAGSYEFTSNLFTGDLGIGAGLPLNKERSLEIGIKFDYLPTFSNGIKNNIRASTGLKFGFRSKNIPKVKNDKPIKRQRIY